MVMLFLFGFVKKKKKRMGNKRREKIYGSSISFSDKKKLKTCSCLKKKYERKKTRKNKKMEDVIVCRFGMLDLICYVKRRKNMLVFIYSASVQHPTSYI
jgi:hypothetical protein